MSQCQHCKRQLDGNFSCCGAFWALESELAKANEHIEKKRNEAKVSSILIRRYREALNKILEIPRHNYSGERIWSTSQESYSSEQLIAKQALAGEEK